MENFKHLFLDQLNDSKNIAKTWLYFIETSETDFEMKLEFGDSDELFNLPNLEFVRMLERTPIFKLKEELNIEPIEVQFEEQEILLEEIDFFKDKVDTVTVKSFNDVLEFISKVRDETSKSLGIPPKYLQNNGYPSTKTQMSDTDKEMLNKA